MSPEEIGAMVRESREMCGLPQTGLARLMGDEGHKWVQATVTEIERGRRNLRYSEALTLRKLIGFDAGVPEAVEMRSAAILARIRELIKEQA